MLKAAEIEIKKEHQVLMVNKTTSFKKQGKSKGKNKKSGKKAATPPVKPKSGPKPDAECYYCKEKGHWKRNCSKYLADLKSGLVKKKKEGMEHWTAVKNIPKYLKRTKDMFLCYGGDQELVVTSYTDASWNTDPDDSKSQSGYVFILNGAAVSWASSKQCTVAKSSTESEYIAASEASSEAVWMKRFIVELGVVPSALDPFVIYCDNMGAIANAQEPRSHKRLKHIKLRYHSIREYIEDGEVKICKVHTDLNVADPLTKALPRAKHDQHQNAMGVSGNDGPHVVGGVVFIVRKEVNYFNFSMRESVQGWRQKWFYLWDILASGRRSNLPPFEDVLAVVPKKSWQNTLTAEENESKRHRKINEDLMTTSESSPSGRDDDDADAIPSPAPSRETSALQVTKGPSRLFAEEDDLESIFSEEDDGVPLSKRAKIISDKAESAKESMPSTAESDHTATPPPRTVVAKVKASTVNPSASASAPPSSSDHPIHAAVDIVVDFAGQFVRLEAENTQLRKAAKTSADQVLEANRLASEAQSENTNLKDELKKLKKKMKEEQEVRHKAFVEADKKEGAVRESIENTADMPVDRTNKLRVDSMSDALSFEAESSNQIQDLLKKTKGALSSPHFSTFDGSWI
ncbi:hypothetical protein QYE76_046426 [Lolium multiflorum]|uniref:CCHC-type domain-containing protein n=1 Tax=Lolium multiflorum TaxID=4521 RepID=A0AAD8X124_LOLMU|nr:hypothetical protein QYE76_046426 [Lolium multiflorum]